MNGKIQRISLLIMLFGFVNLFSQNPPADIVFFNPTVGTAVETISPSGGTGDDSQLFINAIDAVKVAGGGTVTVNAGIFRILEVDMQSNVHLEISSGATLLPFNPSTSANNAMFNADTNSGITNFSIVGTGGKFTVDMSALDTSIRIRVISFKNCNNFKVANFHIIDNYTVFSSLAFGSNYRTTSTANGARIDLIRGVPNFGLMDNISMINGHYGYGLVQVQGGNNLLFRDLTSVGGVALRLETGFDLLQYTELYDFNAIKLDNIWGRNLECTNGQSVLQLSPHTLDQGFFDVSGVVSTSCEAGVVWSAGFSTTDQETDGLTPGGFSSSSMVRNVTANFGQDAQLHPSKRLRYMPCQLRVARSNGIGISTSLNVDGESRSGPSIGAVMREEDKSGHYPLDFPDTEVTANGFNIESYYLPPRAIHRNSYDDYEICEESVSGVNFFVPAEFRNTPNPRNPLENGSLAISEFDTSEVRFYPNPTSGKLTINFPESLGAKVIQVFNVIGKKVGSFKIENKKEIDLSYLTKGIYFLHVENSTSKKIVLY